MAARTDDSNIEAFGIKLQDELAVFQANLFVELQAIIASQHEALLNNLNRQSSASSFSNHRKEFPQPIVTESAAHIIEPKKIQLGMVQQEDPKQETVKTARLAGADGGNGNVAGNLASNPSVKLKGFSSRVFGEDDHHESKGSVVTDDTSDHGVDLKVDGAFSSMFNATSLEDTDLGEPHYHVESLYSDRGYAQQLARSEYFINLTLLVILINAVYIGVDADWNKADKLYEANAPYIICDNAFCAYFTFELAVRFLAFRRPWYCCKDGWFKFDASLVSLMVLETWIVAPLVVLLDSGKGAGVPVQPLRLLRLFRLTRMARLMRSFPELVTMTKGMKIASRAVMSSLMMLTLMIYTFAIVLNMGLKDEDQINATLKARNFETIPRTMWTLLMDGIFLDSPGLVLTVLIFSDKLICWAAVLVFMVFILLSAITVLNMLIGVLCEVVSTVARAEKDNADIRLAKASILLNLKKFENGQGCITKSELMHVFSDKQSKSVLKSLNIDRLFLLELQQMLFPHEHSTVSIKCIMELMLMCRGDLPATVQHIASAQASLCYLLDAFEQRLCQQLHEIKRAPHSGGLQLSSI